MLLIEHNKFCSNAWCTWIYRKSCVTGKYLTFLCSLSNLNMFVWQNLLGSLNIVPSEIPVDLKSIVKFSIKWLMACVFYLFFFFFLRVTNILGIRPGIYVTDRNAYFGVFVFLLTSLQIFRWQERIITCLLASRESNRQKNSYFNSIPNHMYNKYTSGNLLCFVWLGDIIMYFSEEILVQCWCYSIISDIVPKLPNIGTSDHFHI